MCAVGQLSFNRNATLHQTIGLVVQMLRELAANGGNKRVKCFQPAAWTCRCLLLPTVVSEAFNMSHLRPLFHSLLASVSVMPRPVIKLA